MAVALAKGQPIPTTFTLSKVNNGTKDVPSVLLDPVPVTIDNIKSTVVADGFWTAQQILNTPELIKAGQAVGIQ
jgi:D-xylose transport system substrate-binding protein